MTDARAAWDPLQNFMHSYPHPLDAIFHPKSVAVIGAKDTVGSVGRTLLLNLMTGKDQRPIYPVNPKRSEVLGLKAYPTIKEVPEQVDLALIVTPAKTVPGLVQECVDAKVKGIIIISAGFKELGEAGLQLEQEILAITAGKEVRLIGPNCLGLMLPRENLNASFAKGIASDGHIAFMSQSGAMCTAVLDWSINERLGFSSFTSIGSMLDVGWADLIRYFGQDPHTNSILIYMETIGDPRAFLSAAREVALNKPIIVIKPGRSLEAAKAAASHTGSLTGSDEVFEAALERVGVLRVNAISELFHMTEVLGKQPRPKGPNLQIVTNAGGPAVLATDAAILAGAKLPAPASALQEQLKQFLPEAASVANPIDILGDADASRYEKTLEVLSQDPNADGILVILSPQDMTDPTGTAEALRPYAKMKDKPLIASWMGGAFVEGGIELLNNANIPTFEYPDNAAWSFATMWRYAENVRALYETPMPLKLYDQNSHTIAQEIIKKALEQNRTLLNEYESKQILAAYGIPVVKTLVAKTEEEAVHQASVIGYPVVLKLFSDTITHKSDLGGVKLNLQSEKEVRLAFQQIQHAVINAVGKEHFQGVTVQAMVRTKGLELILGSSCDPQFGPVLLFGAGGVMVEIFGDRSLGFPPLNTTLARRMIQKTKISHALQGFRGQQGVSMPFLEETLINFSQMIASLPRIKECDINPLLASHNTLTALDARIVLHAGDEADLPKLSIRPYPIEYVTKKPLKNGQTIILRPIRPDDEPKVKAFHKELSENSVRQRYFEFKSLDERTAHNRLVLICSDDFDHQIALVAEPEDKSEIMGIARLTRFASGKVADLKMLIGDAFHGIGLGTLMVEELLSIAKQEAVTEITAQILSENSGMLHILKKVGFTFCEDPAKVYTFATKKL